VNGCSGSPDRSSVPRPEPEGANNYLPGQLPHRPISSSPKAYDDYVLNADEKLGLLEADQGVTIGEAGLESSATQLAPKSLLPAIEETPEQPSFVAASASMDKMSSDTLLSPSETSLASQTDQRLPTDTEDILYPDTDRDFALTKLAIKKLQKNRLLRQRADTSTDDDRRKSSVVDSGRRFRPVLRKSISPESEVTADTLSPGRSSTSTFLFDSESSESDVGAVRTLTLRSIAKMKRKQSKRTSTLNVLVNEPELVTPPPEPDHFTTPTTVRTRSRSRSPQTQSSLDRAKDAWGSPIVSDVTPIPATPFPPPALSPAPISDHAVEAEPGRQSAAISQASTPAGQISPDTPVGQTTPVATQPTTPVATEPTTPVTQHTSPASQAPPPDQQSGQPLQVAVDNMKDVQKMERTDAEGRKTTVYKLTPKAGSMFPAPVWPRFAAASNLRSTSLVQTPTAGTRLDQGGDAPARDSLAFTSARPSDIRRSTAADQQTIDRLKLLADQRGENVKPTVSKKIQGVSARPQVRSSSLAHATALQEPLASNADVSAPVQDNLPSSVHDRFSYAPFTAPQPASQFDWNASDFQLSDENVHSGLVEKLLHTDSLSKFPYLSGERSHTELSQRMNVDVTVSDAASSTNVANSQFLRDRFNSQKKCFKGLIESSPQAYLSGVSYEDLQPETQSLLSRFTARQSDLQTNLQTIRSSFLLEARPDYPQQPSSSQLEHRISFVPSDAARPDVAQHPSVSSIAVKPEVMSRPDDFLHPSLHRISAPPIPARPDDALHPSQTRLSHIAKYDEALHPSLSRLQTARPSQVPARLDDHLHPSLTRVQLKPSGTGRLLTDLEKTTTATTVVDKEYFLFDEPSTPDEYLHPSTTRIVSGDSGRSELTTRTAPARDKDRPHLQPAKPDDDTQPSTTRLPMQDRSKITTSRDDVTRRSSASLQRTASLDKKETLPPPVPARPDDILHTSSTQLKQRTSTLDRETLTIAVDRKEPVPAKTDDILHPSATRFSERFSTRGTLDSATSTTSVEKKETIPARTDDILHPSFTQFEPRASTRGTLHSAASTTAVDRKGTLPFVPARTDDILHPSATQFSQRLSTRGTLDSATLNTAVDRKETVPAKTDDILHPSSTRFQPRGSIKGISDSAASTSAVDRKEKLPLVPARTDDILHPSATQFSQRLSTRGILDSATSTTAVDRKETVPARTDDILHPSSTQFQSRVSTRGALDSTTTTTSIDRKETLPPVPARTDDILHPSSTQFQSRASTRSTFDSATSTAGTFVDRKDTFPPRPDDINRSYAAQVTAQESSQAGTTFDATRSVAPTVGITDTLPYPSSSQMSARDRAHATPDSAASTTARSRDEALAFASARPDDVGLLHPYSSQNALWERETAAADMGESARQSSMRMQQHDVFRAALDTSSSPALTDRTKTLQSESAGLNDTTQRSSIHFLPRRSATAADRKESLPESAPSGDIIHASATQFPSQDSVRDVFDFTTSGTAVNKKETLTSVTTDEDDVTYQDDIIYPSFARESVRDRPAFNTDISAATLPPDAFALSDDSVRPFPPRLSYRDSFQSTTSGTSGTAAVGLKQTLPSMTAGSDNTSHLSRAQFTARDSGRARATSETATSTTALGVNDVLPPVSVRPDDILHPSSTQFRPSESTRGTLHSTTSATDLGRRDRLSSVPARPDDIIHPSATQIPLRDSTRRTLDTATSTVGLDRRETFPTERTRREDMFRSSDQRRSESTRSTMDGATSTTAPGRHESILPLVPARLDDIMHPSSTQFSQRDSTRGTLDAATSATGLTRKENFPSVPAKPDDIIHPSTTQFRSRESKRSTMDNATSTTVLGRHESILPLVPARPDDIAHPSSTQFPRPDSTRATFDISTSTTSFDSIGRPDDIRHPPFTETSRRSFDQHDDWEFSRSQVMEDFVPAIEGREEVRSSMRSRSDLQLSEDQYRDRQSEGYEASYPSEFMHASLTDKATIASVGRPSSVKIRDQDDAFASHFQDYVRGTTAETAENGRRSSDRQRITDEKYVGPADLSNEARRSSMQRPSASLGLATVPETSGENKDSSRQRRTVTWDLGEPRAASDVDARLADSLSNVRDANSASRTSMSGTSAARSSEERLSVDGRRSSASFMPTNYVNARDSRIVTREHIARKHQLDDTAAATASWEGHSQDAADERRRERELVAAGTEDQQPRQRASDSIDSGRPHPSSDRAGTRRLSDAAAAADDDAPLRQQQTLDLPSFSDSRRFNDVENWLLKSPCACVSRPPCGGALREDSRRVDRSTNTDAPPCQRQSSGHDVTRSPTHRDVAAADSRAPQPTPASHAALTSRDPCREMAPAAASRMHASGRDCSYACRPGTDIPALRTTRYDRGHCLPDVSNYRSLFARGFVPSTPSTSRRFTTFGQPCPTCQSSRQPPCTQQVQYESIVFKNLHTTILNVCNKGRDSSRPADFFFCQI